MISFTSSSSPYCTWHVLDIGDSHVVKRIVVNPGERLSLQYHNHRSERWTAVSGNGIVEIDGTEHALQAGHMVDIPLKATHRVSCTGDKPLVFIEIQFLYDRSIGDRPTENKAGD